MTKYINPAFTRDRNARGTYFKYNKPQFGKYYYCAYCGKLLPRQKVNVDHIYPVAKAQYSKRLQWKLKRKGIPNINHPNNLVAACRKCNNKKGTQMGLWIIKGRLGSHAVYWKARHTFDLVMLAGLLFIILELYFK